MRKRRVDGGAKLTKGEGAERREDCDVRQVLDPRVGNWPRQRVGVQLLGHVCDDWVGADDGRCDPTTMNQNVEVLLLGPGLSGKNFAPMLDQANITSITDESDLVSELATIASPNVILGLVPTAVDVAEIGVDTLRNTARFFWEVMKDPSEAHDPMTILTGEHSMQNYLQEHAAEVEAWNEAVLAEHRQ